MSLREHEWLLSAENQQSIANTSPDGHDLASCTMDVNTMFPPPGEEGFSFSHGAEEISLYADLEQITTERSRHLNLRDHSGHVAQQLADWSTQYDILTDALLHYRHHHQTTAPSPAIDSSFSMKVVDIFTPTLSIMLRLSSMLPYSNMALFVFSKPKFT
ncbi:hypothetical protein BDR07DRAFT_1501033 [Suillus spraguei]|nr:hypothetical protein BDR07DRAFT_1501033 [Suillus spraguei]